MSIRKQYEIYGVDEYYKNNYETYCNPHEGIIHRHIEKISQYYDLNNSLDLCCGNGLVTKKLRQMGINVICGCDPYMNIQYTSETGFLAYNYDFKTISQGVDWDFNNIICSFGLHLCPDSLLPNVLLQLALSTKRLIVITPNNRPNINDYFKLERSIYFDKVKTKIFTSILKS